MPSIKEDVASDFKTLSIGDQIWVTVEIGNDYIQNQSVENQHEFAGKLGVEGVEVQAFCRKNKDAETHT